MSILGFHESGGPGLSTLAPGGRVKGRAPTLRDVASTPARSVQTCIMCCRAGTE